MSESDDSNDVDDDLTIPVTGIFDDVDDDVTTVATGLGLDDAVDDDVTTVATGLGLDDVGLDDVGLDDVGLDDVDDDVTTVATGLGLDDAVDDAVDDDVTVPADAVQVAVAAARTMTNGLGPHQNAPGLASKSARRVTAPERLIRRVDPRPGPNGEVSLIGSAERAPALPGRNWIPGARLDEPDERSKVTAPTRRQLPLIALVVLAMIAVGVLLVAMAVLFLGGTEVKTSAQGAEPITFEVVLEVLAV